MHSRDYDDYNYSINNMTKQQQFHKQHISIYFRKYDTFTRGALITLNNNKYSFN